MLKLQVALHTIDGVYELGSDVFFRLAFWKKIFCADLEQFVKVLIPAHAHRIGAG